jgi:hypothetical protein
VELGTKSGEPTEGEIDVHATDAAAARFFIDPSAMETARLPPLERVYAPVRKRPAARVLLEATKLANADGPLIVMAEQPVGRGRVLFIGTDVLWQWQTLAPAETRVTPHRTYWQRALRALAPTRPVGGASVWLLPERTRGEVGQPLTVRAIAHGSAAADSLVMNVILPDEKRTTLATVVDAKQAGQWRATFTPTQPGTYRITAAARVEGQPAGEATTVVEVTPGGELADTLPDADLLGRIAQASGGRVINSTDATTWPTAHPEPVVRRATVELWRDGWLLVLLTVVLGLDWLLRLLRGYV